MTITRHHYMRARPGGSGSGSDYGYGYGDGYGSGATPRYLDTADPEEA